MTCSFRALMGDVRFARSENQANICGLQCFGVFIPAIPVAG